MNGKEWPIWKQVPAELKRQLETLHKELDDCFMEYWEENKKAKNPIRSSQFDTEKGLKKYRQRKVQTEKKFGGICQRRIGYMGAKIGHMLLCRPQARWTHLMLNYMCGIDNFLQLRVEGKSEPVEVTTAVVMTVGEYDEGDLDLGDEVVYTGEGGRNINETSKQSHGQASHQNLTGKNLALAHCWVYGVPVRLTRGIREKNHKHYVYGGVYTVTYVWHQYTQSTKGKDDYVRMWRFSLKYCNDTNFQPSEYPLNDQSETRNKKQNPNLPEFTAQKKRLCVIEFEGYDGCPNIVKGGKQHVVSTTTSPKTEAEENTQLDTIQNSPSVTNEKKEDDIKVEKTPTDGQEPLKESTAAATNEKNNEKTGKEVPIDGSELSSESKSSGGDNNGGDGANAQEGTPKEADSNDNKIVKGRQPHGDSSDEETPLSKIWPRKNTNDSKQSKHKAADTNKHSPDSCAQPKEEDTQHPQQPTKEREMQQPQPQPQSPQQDLQPEQQQERQPERAMSPNNKRTLKDYFSVKGGGERSKDIPTTTVSQMEVVNNSLADSDQELRMPKKRKREKKSLSNTTHTCGSEEEPISNTLKKRTKKLNNQKTPIADKSDSGESLITARKRGNNKKQCANTKLKTSSKVKKNAVQSVGKKRQHSNLQCETTASSKNSASPSSSSSSSASSSSHSSSTSLAYSEQHSSDSDYYMNATSLSEETRARRNRHKRRTSTPSRRSTRGRRKKKTRHSKKSKAATSRDTKRQKVATAKKTTTGSPATLSKAAKKSKRCTAINSEEPPTDKPFIYAWSVDSSNDIRKAVQEALTKHGIDVESPYELVYTHNNIREHPMLKPFQLLSETESANCIRLIKKDFRKPTQSDVAAGQEPYPIPVIMINNENKFDYNFQYITDYVEPQEKENITENSYVEWYEKSEEELEGTYEEMIHVTNGRLFFKTLEELNSASTAASYSAIPIPVGLHYRVEIFEHTGKKKNMGFGLRLHKDEKPIQSQQYVMPYLGEVICDDETEKRGLYYDAHYGFESYLMELQVPDEDGTLEQKKKGIISYQRQCDSKYMRNAAAFVCHSCDPNLRLKYVYSNKRKHPTVTLWALRQIMPGEEFTFDYEWPDNQQVRCLCGASTCRGWVR